MLTPHTFSFSAMGTNCSLLLCAEHPSAVAPAAKLAVDEVERIEARYSRYRPTSDLSEINRIAQWGGSLEVDDETAGLLDYAFAAYVKSEGLFDITSGLLRQAWNFHERRLPDQATLDALLPRVGLDKVQWRFPRLGFSTPGMEIDFGGLAKEYAADRAAELLHGAGVQHGFVDLGGDMRMLGPQPDGTPWRIGIRHPDTGGTAPTGVLVASGAIATSGDYERCIELNGQRYGHILDPRTGWPVRGLCSVSVLAEQCLVAGTVSTIAMLKGQDGIAWLETLGLPHLWIDDQGQAGGSISFEEVSPEPRSPSPIQRINQASNGL